MQAYIVQGLMLLYMKAHQTDTGFTQSQINTYPIPTHAIGIVAEFASSIAIDKYNRRLSLGYFFCAIQVACSVVLLVPTMSMAGHLTAFYLSSTSYGINPLLYSWSSNIAARTADDAARSVILASMAASDGLLWTFWGIVFYPASDAPYWRKGYITLLCVCAALSCWLFVVRWVSITVKQYFIEAKALYRSTDTLPRDTLQPSRCSLRPLLRPLPLLRQIRRRNGADHDPGKGAYRPVHAADAYGYASTVLEGRVASACTQMYKRDSLPRSDSYTNLCFAHTFILAKLLRPLGGSASCESSATRDRRRHE